MEDQEKRTSNEWWQEHELFLRMKIYDPDGWDRRNLQHSFYEELVTFEEFERRLFRSTLINR